MSDVAKKVKSSIAEQFKIKDEHVTEKAKITDDLEADSLDMIKLLVTLEEDFNINIPDEEMEQMVTVGDAIKCVENKLALK